MDIQHYLKLLESARKQLKRSITVNIHPDGSGEIANWSGSSLCDFHSLQELESELIRIGTPPLPPKPEFVTVQIPFSTAEYYAMSGKGTILRDACKKVIEPFIPSDKKGEPE